MRSRERPKLFTPGPVEVPAELVEAAALQVHHRSALFREEFAGVRRALRPLFGTVGEVAVLVASGTGAMEAAVANFVSREDRVLVVRSGKYGARWGEICAAYGAWVEWLDLEPGTVVSAGDVARHMGSSAPRAVFAVHSETSTGALNDIESVARVIAGRSMLIVDCVSSIAVHEIRMDDWGIDAAVGASQKGLGLPPGLGFVALGPRAIERLGVSTSSRFYLDLRKYMSSAAENETPFTAATGQIAALARSLDRMGSPAAHIARHARVAGAVREGVRALGFEVFPAVPSNAVTVVLVPESLDAMGLSRVLEEKHGFRIAHGQGALRGRILRIGHLGWLRDEDVVALFEALEAALLECGMPFERGAGVGAVRSALEDSGGGSGHGS